MRLRIILLFDPYFRYGIEFQVIDMRWGQRDESTDDHQTMTICLEEVGVDRTLLTTCAHTYLSTYVVTLSFFRLLIYRASKIFQYSI